MSGAELAGGEEDSTAAPRSRYHIRILDDGTVVFTDLPTGLAEVASVVAGTDPGVSEDAHGGDEGER